MNSTSDRPLEFVDTNVLVYAADTASVVKRGLAEALLDRLWAESCGCCSVQVLQEFHHVVTRKIPRPLKLEQSLAIVQSYSSWATFSPSANDVVAAIGLQMVHRLSFWDALLVHSALALRCGVLWSEDLQPGMQFGALMVRNPFLPRA
jgi:predicted nucleic acid-binding protein